MSYCRFNNTAIDLEECIDTLNEGVKSNEEARKRRTLLSLCQRFIDTVEQFGLDEDVQDLVLRNEDGELINDDGALIDGEGKVIEEES